MTRVAYAAPAFALAVVGIPIYVYLPKFYTDTVGVPIAVVGGILLAVRVFDAVTDPMIGTLSDRTRTPLGRRRPWILGASWPLALAVAMLFAPPQTDPQSGSSRSFCSGPPLWFRTSRWGPRSRSTTTNALLSWGSAMGC
jgi:Na+/melibiose symporter-like transporter